MCSAAEMQAENIFLGIWGVGPAMAKSLVKAGHRTLEDVRNDPHMLSPRQRIGLELYEELCQRIPREEVVCIGDIIRAQLDKVVPGCSMEICGSFRRGKATW